VADITALLPGPTGERNTYTVVGRGHVFCIASSVRGANQQLLAALATGNRVTLGGPIAEQVYGGDPYRWTVSQLNFE
jgi:RHH-type proline utilization regulon transcriptional repressor/proline dehydrogenase/delta 1-pyrroline-5-carboxylate dehydrogenase